MTDLTSQTCKACEGKADTLEAEAVTRLHTMLHSDWMVENDGRALVRRFTFKGFAKASYMANLAAFIGDKEGHHPDIAFGWGYCSVTFTTHAVDGLTQNDFICAAKLDQVVE